MPLRRVILEICILDERPLTRRMLEASTNGSPFPTILGMPVESVSESFGESFENGERAIDAPIVNDKNFFHHARQPHTMNAFQQFADGFALIVHWNDNAELHGNLQRERYKNLTRRNNVEVWEKL